MNSERRQKFLTINYTWSVKNTEVVVRILAVKLQGGNGMVTLKWSRVTKVIMTMQKTCVWNKAFLLDRTCLFTQ